MAIQHRRGNYADFDPTKMVAGEPAVVLGGDPTSSDGKAAYIAFGPGSVKKLATAEDMRDEIYNQTQSIIQEVEEGVADDVERAEAAAESVTESAAQIAQNTQDITDLKADLSELVETVNTIEPFSEVAKAALLNCFAHVAWIDEHGQVYYDALEAALNDIQSISAVYTQSGTVYATDSLDSLKENLVVTATKPDSTQYVVPDSKYTLSGTLTIGISTITVTYTNITTSFNVTVTDPRLVYKLNSGTDVTNNAIDTGVPVFGQDDSFTILINVDMSAISSDKKDGVILNHRTLSSGTIRLGFDNTDNVLHFIANVMYSDFYVDYYTPGKVSALTPHNLIWAVRMSNKNVRKVFYVDGVKKLDRSENVSSRMSDKIFTGNYFIGGVNSTTSNLKLFPGIVNLFEMYNVALDISEINSILGIELQ